MTAAFKIRQPHLEVRTPLNSLPIVATRRNDPFEGQLICGFALVFGAIPLIVLAAEGGDFDWHPAWTAWIFPLAAAGMFLFGLRQWRWRKTITIDKAGVSVEERGLFGGTAWEEPLSAYIGVLASSEDVTRRFRERVETYTLYQVDLHHSDDDLRVTLFASTSERDWLATRDAAARLLGLRAM